MLYICIVIKTQTIMRDLHDPNNPDYEKEAELTREIIFEKLTDEEINFLQEEEDDYRNTISKYMMRMGKVKLELKELIEVLEQTEQTYTLNKLKSIWEI